MLSEIRELYVLAPLLTVTVDVAIEVGAVFLAALTAPAALLVAALAVLPLVVAILGGEEQPPFFGSYLFLSATLLFLFAPIFKLVVYVALEPHKLGGLRRL